MPAADPHPWQRTEQIDYEFLDYWKSYCKLVKWWWCLNVQTLSQYMQFVSTVHIVQLDVVHMFYQA